jgi:fused signal recognition particle receptor
MVRALERGASAAAPEPASGRPHVVLMVGVNGSGKTTTTAKLAARAAEGGARVLLVAADTFRAAAIEQLAAWAERLDVEVVRGTPGGDPGAVAFDALRAAQARAADLVVIDTAGRLHTQHNLMAELRKVRRVVASALPGAPDETLLVLDATTGQNGLAQAREFAQAVEVTGVVLAKLDSSAKGGIAFAVAHELGLPIRFVGVGEAAGDLLPFDAAAFVDGLLAPAPA